MLAISSLAVGCRSIVLLLSFERYPEKCLREYFIYACFCSISYRGKVIIKGVSNIIGIGYSISIFMGHYIDTLDALVFREIRNLIPLHVFLILFQFLSKYHNKPVYFFSKGWRVNFYIFVVRVKFLF